MHSVRTQKVPGTYLQQYQTISSFFVFPVAYRGVTEAAVGRLSRYIRSTLGCHDRTTTVATAVVATAAAAADGAAVCVSTREIK